VRSRYEEEPEPDEEPQTDATAGSHQPTPTVSPPDREFEYRTEVLKQDQVTDGTLVARLNESSADGWDLVELIAAGEQQVLLLRRPKRTPEGSRPVGFLRPG
jgi:hypothetical protein